MRHKVEPSRMGFVTPQPKQARRTSIYEQVDLQGPSKQGKKQKGLGQKFIITDLHLFPTSSLALFTNPLPLSTNSINK